MGRTPCCDKTNVKRGPWSPEEDDTLRRYIEKHGTGGNWITLPSKAGLKRCGKSCRLRWLNYLRPGIKHGSFSEEEDNFICTLYLSVGSRWSFIASKLPGRTDNDVKNHWNTKLRKKLIRAENSSSYCNPCATSTNTISTNFEPYRLPYGNSTLPNIRDNRLQQNIIHQCSPSYCLSPKPLQNLIEISDFGANNGNDFRNSTSQEASTLSNYSSSISWSSNGNFAEKQGFQDSGFESVYDIINGVGFQDESSFMGSYMADLPFV